MKKSTNGTKIALVILAAALVAVVAYILIKQQEYGAGDAFYSSLRGRL